MRSISTDGNNEVTAVVLDIKALEYAQVSMIKWTGKCPSIIQLDVP
jgi:hypothetical protein